MKLAYPSSVALNTCCSQLAVSLEFEFDPPAPRHKPLCEPFRIADRDWTTTPAFDSYWHFAAERHRVFFGRLHQSGCPGTNDPIIRNFRFTNAYRASDRVSQYLIKHVIYSGSQQTEEIFFRILLFKLFNKVETWELLLRNVGELTWEHFDVSAVEQTLSSALAKGSTVYSSAYIMPSAGAAGERKHGTHLRLLRNMMLAELPSAVEKANSFEEVFWLLKSQPSLGDFLAYQFATDLNYSTPCNFDEMDFVKPGPGALNGIRKCFPDLPLSLAEDAIRAVSEKQIEEFANAASHFRIFGGDRYSS